jgi:hypothetical protein
MSHKNFCPLFTAAAVLAFALVALFNPYTGISLRDFAVGVFTAALYGLLIAAFLLRVALILLGVFAVYRAILERHQEQTPT